jgi:hypothetical protein
MKEEAEFSVNCSLVEQLWGLARWLKVGGIEGKRGRMKKRTVRFPQTLQALDDTGQGEMMPANLVRRACMNAEMADVGLLRQDRGILRLRRLL